MEINIRKTILLTVDALGVGELPDAFRFGHRGANTLQHIAEATGKFNIPNLSRLGLGNLTYIRGAERTVDTLGFYGRMRFKSEGIDPVTGHWEIAGVVHSENFTSFGSGLSEEFREMLFSQTGRDFLPLSWPEQENLLNGFGAEHLISGKPLLLLLPNSEIIVVAHEKILTAAQLRFLAMDVREVANLFHVATVSFTNLEGEPGDFVINLENKEALPMAAPSPTVLDSAQLAGIPVITLGSVSFVFANKGITTGTFFDSLEDLFEKLLRYIRECPSNDFEQAIIWARYEGLYEEGCKKKNLINYKNLLEELDSYIPRLYRAMSNEDLLVITSSHGADPNITTTGPTREHVPILTYCRMFKPQGYGALGVRKSASDVAETLAEAYDLPLRFASDSFWPKLLEKL